jgi:D-psicose/D-tagatose/L-ribulose 3-epimerase
MNLQVTFGVSTWLWASPFNNDTIALFGKIKAMGYDVVEIPVEDTGLIDTRLIKEALKEHDLKALICGAFGPERDLTNDDTAYHQKAFNYIEACLDICNQLDVPFFAGPMFSAVGKARLASPGQRKIEWDRAVANLTQVCKMAETRGLKLGIEPLNRFESDMVNTTDDVLRLINDIGHPAANIALDGFHMSIEEPDIEAAIVAAGDKLIHLQVSENYRGTPGSGQTNWAAYKAGLQRIGYKGVISIESFTPEVKELAGAVCIWKPLAASQDEFASKGLQFLKGFFK